MDAAALAELRVRLLRLRGELVGEGAVSIAADSDAVAEKPDEDAQPLEEMNKVIASNRNRERAERLAEIEAALARMAADPDGFGDCEGCGEPIARRRLELMPWTRLCIECQARQEHDGAPAGRRHITDYR
jgi:DnaK suppressor protein